MAGYVRSSVLLEKDGIGLHILLHELDYPSTAAAVLERPMM